MKPVRTARRTIAPLLEPLVGRELVGINALDSAIARQSAPDYAYFYVELKGEKQVNLAQLMNVFRMHGLTMAAAPQTLKLLARGQASLTQALSTALTLRALRAAQAELVNAYAAALESAPRGPVKVALRKVLGRAVVGATLLSAHIARLSGDVRDAAELPRTLASYFDGDEARVCMRCLLDRPGGRAPLERHEPHPLTYICAACHDEVYSEFPVDLLVQLDRAPEKVREARIIHKALGRPSRLNALTGVLHTLSGIEPERPIPASERAVVVPAATGVPGPRREPPARLTATVPAESDLEAAYVRALLDYRSPRRHW